MYTNRRAVAASALALAAFAGPAAADAAPPGSTPPASDGPITFLRADLGLNAPSGIFGITAGHVFDPRLAVEVSGGFGGGANFVVAAGRFYFAHPYPSWRLGVGVGGSLGFNRESCCIEGETPPDSPSYWLHQELALSRLASHSFTVLLAAGVEELMSGAYHVDVTDVNFVDRKAIDVQPYLRVGIGWGF